MDIIEVLPHRYDPAINVNRIFFLNLSICKWCLKRTVMDGVFEIESAEHATTAHSHSMGRSRKNFRRKSNVQ